MKSYLVVGIENAEDNYLVDDLTELITEMYSQDLVYNEFEVVLGWFFNNYKVFVSENNIIELTEDMCK
jgi:hypothetical protein